MKEKKVAPPKEFTENVYVIQDLIKKVPELYKEAQKDWNAGQKKVQQYFHPGYYAYHHAPYPDQQEVDLNIWSAEPASLDIEDPE